MRDHCVACKFPNPADLVFHSCSEILVQKFSATIQRRAYPIYLKPAGNVFFARAVTIYTMFNLSAVEPSLRHAPSIFQRSKSRNFATSFGARCGCTLRNVGRG